MASMVAESLLAGGIKDGPGLVQGIWPFLTYLCPYHCGEAQGPDITNSLSGAKGYLQPSGKFC